MEENEKVSIGVPIYRVENFLSKLIDSLINQTYKNLEIILVDDGSPDGSGKICDEYAKKESRIKVIHKENGGVSSARNKVLEIATGKWLVFVDGDDWLESDCIEYMLRLVHETNSEMGMSLNNFTTRNRNQIDNDLIESWSPEKAACTMLYPYLAIGCWNKIFNLDFLRKNSITFTHKLSGEGMVFIVTAAQYANHIGVGRKKIYNYRLNNENSAMTKYRLEMGTYAQKAINKIKSELILRTPALINACNWYIWKNYNFVLFLIIATDSKKENIKLYKDCLKNNRMLFISANLKADLKLKTKIKNLIIGLFPVLYAKRSLKNQRKTLKKDLME